MATVIKSNKPYLGPLNLPTLQSLSLGAFRDAYSLRAIDGFTGDVVRVRRSSDNTEQNFTAEQVIDGSLASFCAATNGFVVNLFSQASGSTRHFSAVSTAAQPKIVTSGAVELLNGKPCIVFDGVDDYLFADMSLAQPYSNATVSNVPPVEGSTVAISAILDSRGSAGAVSPATSLFAAATVSGTPLGQGFNAGNDLAALPNLDAGTHVKYISIANGASSAVYRDGVLLASGNAGTNAFNRALIGATQALNAFSNIKYQELVVYGSAIDESRAEATAANQQRYYG